jgi:chromosomal replication initiator protein
MTVIPKNVAPLPPPAEQEIDRDILEVSSESAILPRVIKLSSILVAVSNATAVNIREIISPRRSAYIVRARMVYFWIARKYTSRSLPQIGHSCGNRDHSTVMHGINKVERQMDGFAADIAKVKLILQLTDE